MTTHVLLEKSSPIVGRWEVRGQCTENMLEGLEWGGPSRIVLPYKTRARIIGRTGFVEVNAEDGTRYFRLGSDIS